MMNAAESLELSLEPLLNQEDEIEIKMEQLNPGSPYASVNDIYKRVLTVEDLNFHASIGIPPKVLNDDRLEEIDLDSNGYSGGSIGIKLVIV